MSKEQRQEPRFPVRLRVLLQHDGSGMETQTTEVSLHGFGTRLPKPIEVGTKVETTLWLPDGERVRFAAVARRCVNGRCGFEFTTIEDENRWQAYVNEEAATGSLWRMIGRFAKAPSEKQGLRLVLENRTGLFRKKNAIQHFHVVGENGEAYRICFEKHPWHAAEGSALFADCRPLTRMVKRILDDTIALRLADEDETSEYHLCELERGGYAYLAKDENGRTGLISLCTDELILLRIGDESLFPHFDDDECERIACDTYRLDQQTSMFSAADDMNARRARLKRSRKSASYEHRAARSHDDVQGLAAIERAQFASETVQKRVYGERTIALYPEVWAKVLEDGRDLMGPTMRDGDKALLLVLVGSRAPRVVGLSEDVVLLRGGRSGAGI